MSTAFLLPSLKTKLFATDGTPLAFGKIYTAKAGTTAGPSQAFPKPMYTDSSAAAQCTNPIILDSNGETVAWVSGFYSVAVYNSAGVLQYTSDNVSAGSGSGVTGGSSSTSTGGGGAPDWVGVVASVTDLSNLPAATEGSAVWILGHSTTNDGGQGMFRWTSADESYNVSNDAYQGLYVAPSAASSGSSGAWVRQLEGFVSPEMYGAKGDFNGATGTDDTARIAAALHSAVVLAIPVHLRPGAFYLTSSTLTVGGSSLYIPAIACVGGTASIGSPTITTGAQLEIQSTGSTVLTENGMEGVHFVGGGSSCVNLRLKGCIGYSVRRCRFDNSLYGVEFTLNGSDLPQMCVVSDSVFLSPCRTALHYTGSATMAGVGARDCIVNNNGTDPAILIDSGSTPVLSPLNIILRPTSANNSLITANGTLGTSGITFEGIMKVVGEGSTIATGIRQTYLCGSLMSVGFNTYGQLVLCYSAKSTGASYGNSPIYFDPHPADLRASVGTSGTTISVCPPLYSSVIIVDTADASKSVVFETACLTDGSGNIVGIKTPVIYQEVGTTLAALNLSYNSTGAVITTNFANMRISSYARRIESSTGWNAGYISIFP